MSDSPSSRDVNNPVYFECATEVANRGTFSHPSGSTELVPLHLWNFTSLNANPVHFPFFLSIQSVVSTPFSNRRHRYRPPSLVHHTPSSGHGIAHRYVYMEIQIKKEKSLRIRMMFHHLFNPDQPSNSATPGIRRGRGDHSPGRVSGGNNQVHE